MARWYAAHRAAYHADEAAISIREAVPQRASPRGQAAILSEKQKLALIKDTRNMIERHHKTMHDAFLAMDKARSRPTPLACLKPGPCPNHPPSQKPQPAY